MSKVKFNSNYKRNAAKSEEIQQIVDEMMEEKVNKHPFDFLFRRNCENYPKTSHQVLGLPGIFKKMEGPNVYTLKGRSLQQDFVESVLPDGEQLTYEATLGLEQLASLLTPEKTEIIYLYKNFNIAKHEKPSIPLIVTNYDIKPTNWYAKSMESFSPSKSSILALKKLKKI